MSRDVDGGGMVSVIRIGTKLRWIRSGNVGKVTDIYAEHLERTDVWDTVLVLSFPEASDDDCGHWQLDGILNLIGDGFVEIVEGRDG